MYQRENNGLGCKVRTKQANKELNATNSIKQTHGERYAICSSSDIRCVLNATALAKWFTTLLDWDDVVNHLANAVAFNTQRMSFDEHGS